MTGSFIAIMAAFLMVLICNISGLVSNKDYYLFMAGMFLIALPCLAFLTGDHIGIAVYLTMGTFYAAMWWRHKDDDDENHRRRRKKLAERAKSKLKVSAPQPTPAPTKS